MKNSITKLVQYKKNSNKIVALTAYDYSTAKALNESDVDLILVGDSLAMVALGYKDTISITMEEMLHHTKAVTRGAINVPVIADMPFMSYHCDLSESIKNAGRFLKEGNAQGVKLEGASEKIITTIKELIATGIPVLGHLGFTPQYLNLLGGYYVQAKTSEKIKLLIKQALELQNAGVFGVVLEMIPAEVAEQVTNALNIPTIGIGAGPYCDGQILVTDDLIGKFADFTPTFIRKYANINQSIKEAINLYSKDVRSNEFPSLVNESFHLNNEKIHTT